MIFIWFLFLDLAWETTAYNPQAKTSSLWKNFPSIMFIHETKYKTVCAYWFSIHKVHKRRYYGVKNQNNRGLRKDKDWGGFSLGQYTLRFDPVLVSQMCSHCKKFSTLTICALFCMFVFNNNSLCLPTAKQCTMVLNHKIFI